MNRIEKLIELWRGAGMSPDRIRSRLEDMLNKNRAYISFWYRRAPYSAKVVQHNLAYHIETRDLILEHFKKETGQ